MDALINLKYIVNSLVYSFLGILILLASFWFVEKITPENLWREIIEKHNIALAIIAAAFIIAVSVIIASAIHG